MSLCKLKKEVINGDAQKKRTWYRKRLTIKVAGRKKAEENTMTPELKARTIEVSGRLERSNCKIPINERKCKFRIARQGIQGTDQQNHRAEGKNETPKLKTTRLPSSKNTNRFKKRCKQQLFWPLLAMNRKLTSYKTTETLPQEFHRPQREKREESTQRPPNIGHRETADLRAHEVSAFI